MANIINQYGQVKVGVRVPVSQTSQLLLDTYGGASAAYSLRKLRTAYTGYAIRVRRSSDNASQDIGFDANGILDTASLLSFVGAGTGFVSVWYDQSGNGKNATQTSASNQPLIVVDGVIYTLNGKPIIRNPDTRIIRSMNVPFPTLQSRPVSIIATGKIYQLPANPYGNTAWYLGGDVNVGGGSRYEFLSSPTGFAINRRGNSSSIVVNNGTNVTSPFIQQGHFASGTITNRLNGVDVTSVVTDSDQFTTNSNFVIIGANPNSVEFMASIGMYEYIFYFTDKTSDRAGIESNINTYYSIYSSDADAQAFITAADITDSTQKSAITTLVTDLKSANIWTKMKAIYPFVGGTASSHKFNLKDPRDLDAAYRLTFYGGGIHSSTGYKPNGTTGYANTFLKSVDAGLSTSSIHLSFYGRTQNTTQGGEVGCYDDYGYRGPLLYGYGNDGGSGYYTNYVYRVISDYQNNVTKGASPTATQPIGLLLGSSTSNVYKDLYINNVRVNANYSTENTQVNNGNIYIGALNYLNVPNTPIGSFTNTQLAFVTIGSGLSSIEATAFYTAVQKYQTSLGRQV